MSTAQSVSPQVSTPVCPECRAPLQLGSHDQLDSWTCPSGHGLALTLSESYGHVQDDELAELWRLARSTSERGRPSPFPPHAPMAHITLPYDADEVAEGEPGDGPALGEVALDIDVDQQFIWFDEGELDELPQDLPDAEPTAQEQARLAQVRSQFASDLDAAMAAGQDRELTERLYRRVAARPGLHRTLDGLGRAITAY